jgi:hypothetical protein
MTSALCLRRRRRFCVPGLHVLPHLIGAKNVAPPPCCWTRPTIARVEALPVPVERPGHRLPQQTERRRNRSGDCIGRWSTAPDCWLTSHLVTSISTTAAKVMDALVAQTWRTGCVHGAARISRCRRAPIGAAPRQGDSPRLTSQRKSRRLYASAEMADFHHRQPLRGA